MQMHVRIRVRPTHSHQSLSPSPPSLSLGTPSNINSILSFSQTHHIHTQPPSHYQNIINTPNLSLFLSLSATHSCTFNSLRDSLIIPMKPHQHQHQQQQLPKSFTVSSSPGRPEKLPSPGLARLFRGKSDSRRSSTTRTSSAAGPTRSSPMFISRNKSLKRSTSSSSALVSAAAAADGEPTSPKVTCIGQVRIRKRYKKNINQHTNEKIAKDLRSAERKTTSWCLFDFKFRILPKRKRKRACWKFFCWRWNRHHHHHSSGNNNNKEMKAANNEAPPIAFVRDMRVVESESEEEEEEEGAEDEGTKRFVSSSSAGVTMHFSEEAGPPKNALLLMRCRSAPHNRSSALSLCRFPVSPVPASENEEDEKEETTTAVVPENNETRMTSATEVLMSSSSSMTTTTIVPLSLMRCKSEPAKSGEKLMEVKWNGSGGGEVKEVGPTQSPSPILLLH